MVNVLSLLLSLILYYSMAPFLLRWLLVKDILRQFRDCWRQEPTSTIRTRLFKLYTNIPTNNTIPDSYWLLETLVYNSVHESKIISLCCPQDGDTSLHYAAENGHSEIVQLLLIAGATDFPNQVGMSVITHVYF